jgi:hypothetical protein
MNEFNMIINELCDRFNCTINELIPAYAHYKILCDSICLFFVAIALVISIKWLIDYKHKKYWIKDSDFLDFNLWFSVISIILSGLILVIVIIDIILWIVAPEILFINAIFD